MTDFLDAVANLRLYGDAIGLALLPLGFGLAGWFWWKAREQMAGTLPPDLWQQGDEAAAGWPLFSPPPLHPMSPEDFEQAMLAVRKLLEPHVDAGRPMALRAEREAIPDPRHGDLGLRTRKGRLFVLFVVEDPARDKP